MSTYPKKVKLFAPWAKAMVAGATVDKPSYSTKTGSKGSRMVVIRRRRRRRRKKKKNAQA